MTWWRQESEATSEYSEGYTVPSKYPSKTELGHSLGVFVIGQ